MKIAITAAEPRLDAEVDPRFGRCPLFLIVETEDLSLEAVENENQALGQGAGIQSARLLAEHGVQWALTGNCGPNAHEALTAAGIQVVVGCAGTVRDVVEQFKAGRLSAAGAPNVPGHTGVPSGAPPSSVSSESPAQRPSPRPGGGGGAGRGRGMGRGRGGGGGQGGGQGRGRGGGQGGGRGMGRGRGRGGAR